MLDGHRCLIRRAYRVSIRRDTKRVRYPHRCLLCRAPCTSIAAMPNPVPAESLHRDSWFSVFLAFLRLGLTSFGGPVAHLGYFRAEFVARRKLARRGGLRRHRRALPVPARPGEQPGRHHHRHPARRTARRFRRLARLQRAVGAGDDRFRLWRRAARQYRASRLAARAEDRRGRGRRAGRLGHGAQSLPRPRARDHGGRRGAARARVAQRVRPDRRDRRSARSSAGACCRAETKPAHSEIAIRDRQAAGDRRARSRSSCCSPACRCSPRRRRTMPIALVDSFYRSGSLVFGGGHVVLPLLQKEVVPPGWIGNDAFLAGYGAAQAVPGPLFTFSAYLGTVMQPGAQWLARRADLPCRDLSAVVPAADRRAAVLGRAAPPRRRAIGAQGRQRGGRRAAARGALHAGLDQRDPRPRRFRHRHRRFPVACLLARAALDRRDARRGRARRYWPASSDPPPPLLLHPTS